MALTHQDKVKSAIHAGLNEKNSDFQQIFMLPYPMINRIRMSNPIENEQ